MWPFLHATPDFLCKCDCCGQGCGQSCGEVDCPYCIDGLDFVQRKSFCLDKNGSGVPFEKRIMIIMIIPRNKSTLMTETT